MEKEIYVGEFDFSKILHPIFLVINAIRLRMPICEKKKCKIPIKRKEIGEIGIEVPFEDKLITGVPVKVCRFVFEIEGEQFLIEVKKNIFDKYSEGDLIHIEYLTGFDRIHARIKP